MLRRQRAAGVLRARVLQWRFRLLRRLSASAPTDLPAQAAARGRYAAAGSRPRFVMPHLLDRAEFGRLFVEHSRVLWVVAAAFVPKAAIEDVLQDAAAAALSRLRDFDAATSFRAWMTQIVRFTAANARRRRGRAAAGAQIDPDVVATPVRSDPHAVVHRNGALRPQQADFDDRVLHALNELPEDARASLLLRAVMDMSYADIATTLSLPEGTVASHVHRARTVLRASLAASTQSRHHGESPADALPGGRS